MRLLISRSKSKYHIWKFTTRKSEIFWILAGEFDAEFVASTGKNSKSNLHYSRDITPKRVTGGGARLRGLTPGQPSFRHTLQRPEQDYSASPIRPETTWRE